LHSDKVGNSDPKRVSGDPRMATNDQVLEESNRWEWLLSPWTYPIVIVGAGAWLVWMIPVLKLPRRDLAGVLVAIAFAGVAVWWWRRFRLARMTCGGLAALALGLGLLTTPLVGIGPEGEPGPVNAALAEWAAANLSGSLIAQESIGVGLCDHNGAQSCSSATGQQVYRMHAHSADYVTTNDAAVCAVALAQRIGATKLVIVAHPMQLDRAAGALHDAVQSQSADLPVVVPAIELDVEFWEASVHPQTRSARAWRFWEIAARVSSAFEGEQASCDYPAS